MTKLVMRKDGTFAVSENATTEERIAFAHNMRLAGKQWEDIASICGYSSSVSARLAVRSWMQKSATELEQVTRSEHLVMELDRLDALQDAVWDSAMDGDKKAMDSVIRIIALRARILGLDNITSEVNTSVQTIVVSQDQYVERLKTIAGEVEDVSS